MCCPGSTCGFKTTCNADNVCAITCGALGLPCCPEDDIDDDNNVLNAPDACPDFDNRCASDVCTVCGGVGELCCRDDQCDTIGSKCLTSSRSAAIGVCSEQTCGVPGLPCCDDADYSLECDLYSECVAGSCISCGSNGESCCSSDPPEYLGYCYGECTEEAICTGGQPDSPPPPRPVGPDGKINTLHPPLGNPPCGSCVGAIVCKAIDVNGPIQSQCTV